YSRTYAETMNKTGAHFWVDSLFCPVPIELDEVYPFAQSVVPSELDPGIIQAKQRAIDEFSKTFGFGPEISDGADTVKDASGPAVEYDLRKVKAVADLQFGRGAGNALLAGKVELVKSRKTGKIRNVIVDGRHVLSMRAADGFFTLKFEGGKVLKDTFQSPGLRVIVNEDSAEFNRQGRNVFAGFVLDADDTLIPGDEVLVVDKNDELVAIGRTLMTRGEMLAFERGIAVKVREGAGKPSAPQ
ncbi:MAG: tRNA-guanine(15) transglycosylase, partial [Thermoplasmata archaeon]|nr:tRNA-guanine(15) transglycosylase [Thermoplasmata archaeon]